MTKIYKYQTEFYFEVYGGWWFYFEYNDSKNLNRLKLPREDVEFPLPAWHETSELDFHIGTGGVFDQVVKLIRKALEDGLKEARQVASLTQHRNKDTWVASGGSVDFWEHSHGWVPPKGLMPNHLGIPGGGMPDKGFLVLPGDAHFSMKNAAKYPLDDPIQVKEKWQTMWEKNKGIPLIDIYKAQVGICSVDSSC